MSKFWKSHSWTMKSSFGTLHDNKVKTVNGFNLKSSVKSVLNPFVFAFVVLRSIFFFKMINITFTTGLFILTGSSIYVLNRIRLHCPVKLCHRSLYFIKNANNLHQYLHGGKYIVHNTLLAKTGRLTNKIFPCQASFGLIVSEGFICSGYGTI